MIKNWLFLIAFCCPLFLQCQNQEGALPRWVEKPPTGNNKYYAVGFGSSLSADVAERKARLDANSKLAKQVEPVVITVTSKIDSIVRGNQLLVERVSVVRQKVSATLTNVKELEKFNMESNGTHDVYILVEMPQKEIKRSIVAHIENDKELHSDLIRSATYRSLLKELE